GGKGGVGKSLVSSSLAIGLALSGKKVLAVDLDLGGANLHLFLGVKRLTTTLNTFLTHRGADLWSLPTATDFENLDLLGGDGSQLGSANVHYAKKMSLIRRLSIAPYDVVVCDLGAGTDFNTLDFFLMAHEHMLVTNTEPTALLDAYGLIKTALYRRLDGHVRAMRVEGDLRKRLDDFFFGRAKTETPQSLTAFLAAVRREDAVLADKLKAEAGAFSVRLVINSSMSANDPARVARIGELAVKNLSMAGIETARIPFDMSIRRSIERVVPHVVAQPESPASQALFDLTGGFVPNPSAALSTIRASLVHRRRGLARTSA
ncbi:P-loop NTPase, partial [bacterium]|nr:P-loop NTPase [bacterium]